MIENYIHRPLYQTRIEPWIGKGLIKVLTGQRRVGKSYLLFQIMDTIRKSNPNAKIIYINKELDEFSDINTHNELLEYLKDQNPDKSDIFLFIDEIQDISNFEKALRSLLASGLYDIYITGSNANLLSGELATFLTGRYIEIPVHGLSYAEYLLFHQLEETEDSFLRYLKFGGLPFIINLKQDEEVIFEYLKSIFSTIIYKDVVARYAVRNIRFLENLVRFLADNVGSLVTSKSISDYLKSQKIAISPQVVLNYLQHFESAFLICRTPRSEISGKKIFEIGEKFYFMDLGLRNAIAGYHINDIHKMLENVVYLHLKTAGYKIFVGKEGEKEVDFICERENERIYIQVAYLMLEQKTIDREYGNLLSIKDNYPKFVVSLDKMVETNSYLGITRMHVKDFCVKIVDGIAPFGKIS